MTAENETKTVLRRKQLRDRLIDAAEQAITEQGLSALKAREIATKAGCALGAIYTVFDDLDELILCVNARTLALLEKELAERAQLEPDSQLLLLARAYLDFARREEHRWRALFEHRLPAGRDIPQWYARDRDRLFTLLEAPLKHLLPNEDPEKRARFARTLFAAVHGVVALGMEEKLEPTPPQALIEQLDGLMQLVAAGLALRAAN